MAKKFEDWFVGQLTDFFTPSQPDNYGDDPFDVMNVDPTSTENVWKYQGFVPVSEDDPWADIMNAGGGQPTYDIVNRMVWDPSQTDGLAAPDTGMMGGVDIGIPFVEAGLEPVPAPWEVAAAAVPVAKAAMDRRGRNNAQAAAQQRQAQEERVRTARAQRAANILRNTAASGTGPSQAYYEERFGARPQASRMPVPQGTRLPASYVATGEYIPRSTSMFTPPRVPGIGVAPLEGEVVRPQITTTKPPAQIEYRPSTPTQLKLFNAAGLFAIPGMYDTYQEFMDPTRRPYDPIFNPYGAM
jgi:hypothetical protein